MTVNLKRDSKWRLKANMGSNTDDNAPHPNLRVTFGDVSKTSMSP